MSLTVEDKLAIMELDARACHAWDCGTVDEWVGNYTENGVFEVQNHPAGSVAFRGREELTRLCEGAFAYRGAGPRGKHCHLNHLIEGDGDTASHRCHHIGVLISDGVPRVGSMGVCYNALAHTSDGWKYTHVKIDFDIHL